MDIPASLSMLDIRPIVPELILICVGLVLMLLDLIVKKKETVAFMGIAGTLVALYATCKLYALDGTEGFFASMFVLDGYSSFFKLIFYLNVIMTICISLKYLAVEKASYGEYYALLLFATSGMMIMASAADLIVLYLGLELMALSTYILAGLIRTSSTEIFFPRRLLFSLSPLWHFPYLRTHRHDKFKRDSIRPVYSEH
jgi:NADH-quinone oxidoreductase subunit N